MRMEVRGSAVHAMPHSMGLRTACELSLRDQVLLHVCRSGTFIAGAHSYMHGCSQAVKYSICWYIKLRYPCLDICCSFMFQVWNALHWQSELQQARVSTGVS